MEHERESQIDECVECCVRDGDFSKKKVFRCELCGRWFCQKHIEPRMAYIKSWQEFDDSSDYRAFYYKEINRMGGHPDFRYSQRKLEELKLEEQKRNELIKQALDRMNHYYDNTNPKEQPKEESNIQISEPKIESKIDECRECITRNRDYSKKEVFKCKYCNIWFCEKHLEPKLTGIPDLSIPDKEKEPFYNDLQKTDGHPDPIYTQNYYEKIDQPIMLGKTRKKIPKTMEDASILEVETNPQDIEKPPKPIMKMQTSNNVPKKAILIGALLLFTLVIAMVLFTPIMLSTLNSSTPNTTSSPFPTQTFNQPYPSQAFPSKTDTSYTSLPTQTPPQPTPTIKPTPSQPKYTYEELVDYALFLINSDRNGLSINPNGTSILRVNIIGVESPQNVTLSSINSAQQHAEDMLKNHYMGHWDTQGYKPYMRYTLAGGQGSVSENVAWMHSTGYLDPKTAIANLEFMMVNDDAESDWGHRDNILDPLHNKVSIGIAYDEHNLFLVQDFEDDYISWSNLKIGSNEVTMQGNFAQDDHTISSVQVYFDSVKSLTSQELSNPPYNGGYDAGTYVALVVSPSWQATEGITVEAHSWAQTGSRFDITFDLSPVFAKHGKGIYTLYLWTESNQYFTTLSIWNS